MAGRDSSTPPPAPEEINRLRRDAREARDRFEAEGFSWGGLFTASKPLIAVLFSIGLALAERLTPILVDKIADKATDTIARW